MRAKPEQKGINYAVNQADDDQIINCSKSLISQATFENVARPQLPRHCLNRLEHYNLVEHHSAEVYYYPAIPDRLYHMNQLVSVQELLEQRIVHVKIQLQRKEPRQVMDEAPV